VARPTFITLGPTCHENALLHYLEFQGVEGARIVLVEDLLVAIGRIREEPNASSTPSSSAHSPRRGFGVNALFV
jgi:hypothetical protein